MAQPGWMFRVLVASPSDCTQERKIIPEVIAAWNAVNSVNTSAILEPVLWETHSRPAMGDRPQALLNRQLVDHCDLVVGAFWTRLGTPTGEAESGTVEEIEQFIEAKKPVLLYFSSLPVVPDSLDMDQYKALVAYRGSLKQRGLYWEYDDLSGFREQLQRHLASTMIDLIRDSTSMPMPGHVTAEVSKADPLEEQRRALRVFSDDFDAFLRRLSADWNAERDSDPHNIDDGKYIMARAVDELVHFRSMITHDASGLSATLDEVLKGLKALGRHQLYMDGGKSFRDFWAQGDAFIARLQTVPGIIGSVIAGETEGGITKE